MATVQEIADVITQADRDYNAKWLTGLEWFPEKNMYRVDNNAAWQAQRSGNGEIWLTPEDISGPRDAFRRQKVQSAFGSVDANTFEDALALS